RRRFAFDFAAFRQNARPARQDHRQAEGAGGERFGELIEPLGEHAAGEHHAAARARQPPHRVRDRARRLTRAATADRDAGGRDAHGPASHYKPAPETATISRLAGAAPPPGRLGGRRGPQTRTAPPNFCLSWPLRDKAVPLKFRSYGASD